MGLFSVVKELLTGVARDPMDPLAWKTLGLALLGYVQRSATYLGGLNVSDDFKMCLVAGLLIGVAIIVFLHFNPGEPFDYDGTLSDSNLDALLQKNAGEESAKRAGKGKVQEKAKAKQKGKAEDKMDSMDDAKTSSEPAAKAAGNDPSQRVGLRRRKGGSSTDDVSAGAESNVGSGVAAGGAAARSDDDGGGGGGGDSDSDKSALTQRQEKSLEAKRKEIADRIKALEEVQRMGDKMKRNDEMKSLLGITDDEQLDQAIEQTKRDILSGKKMEMTSTTGRGGWFDTIFYCVMFVLLFYFAERDYGFNILHWLAKIFPKEAEVIRQAQQW